MTLRGVALLAAGLAAALLLATWLARRPRSDRDWAPEQARQVAPRVEGSLVHLADVRDFQYQSLDRFTERWIDTTVDLDRLATVWFAVVPLSARWRAPAHTFVSFGFDDGSYLAVSIESRRTRGEPFSPLRGLLRAYELIYVVGTERDVIGRRAVHEGDPVYLYPIAATREVARALFLDMMARAARLRETPAFYNTLSDNCTTALLRHVEVAAPHRVRAGLAGIMPGYADDVAVRLGLIPGVSSAEEARARYRINDRARAAAGADDFSARIRAAP